MNDTDTSVPKPKPLYALPAAERRERADAFSGLRCRVHVHPYRNSEREEVVTGLVLGVAVPNTGTVADQVIVKTGTRDWLRAISLAQVHSIEVA